MSGLKKIKNALISVYYKDNLEPVIHQLNSLGVKIFSTGGTQQWCTYFNGTNSSSSLHYNGSSVAVDNVGNVYLAGTTLYSSGVATAGAHQDTIAANGDAYLVKFDATGALLWGTYYGGGGFDRGYGSQDQLSLLVWRASRHQRSGCESIGSCENC